MRTAKELVPHTRYIYRPELPACPHCGQPLHPLRHYQWRKSLQTLSGPVAAMHQPARCTNPSCPQPDTYHALAAHLAALPGSTYGMDVVAHLAWWRDQAGLSRRRLHRQLSRFPVHISPRHIGNLLARFQVWQTGDTAVDRRAPVRHHPCIIGLDAIRPATPEQLWVVYDITSARLLACAWLAQPTRHNLTALLQPIADANPPVLAIIAPRRLPTTTTRSLWPHVPHHPAQPALPQPGGPACSTSLSFASSPCSSAPAQPSTLAAGYSR